MERDRNRAIASGSAYEGLNAEGVAPEDISTDNLDQLSGPNMRVLTGRLRSQRGHLMSRARYYSGCAFESLDTTNPNSDYNRTLFVMYKHYQESRKVLNFLEARGGNMYNFDKQSYDRFKDLFGELIRRHPVEL
jgi:hypothetical protein